MTRIRRTIKSTPGRKPERVPPEKGPPEKVVEKTTSVKAPAPQKAGPQKQKKTARPTANTRGPEAETLRIFTPKSAQASRGGRKSGPVERGRADGLPPSSLRLFYALKVPVNVANPLAERQRQLRGNWRAVKPEQMHVTLAYLPGVPPEKLPDLKRLGTRLTEHLAPMQVNLRGTGYFPNEGSPRVWFVKVEAEGLDALAAGLRAGIAELGLPTEELPFKAHITLARKKGPAPRVPPLTFDLGWQAGAVTLCRSILRKSGPIYETESTFRLRGETPPPATPLTQEST